jgi:hypothetical protein
MKEAAEAIVNLFAGEKMVKTVLSTFVLQVERVVMLFHIHKNY